MGLPTLMEVIGSKKEGRKKRHARGERLPTQRRKPRDYRRRYAKRDKRLKYARRHSPSKMEDIMATASRA